MIDNRDPNPLHLAQLQALNMLIKKGYSGDIEDIRDQLIEESYSKPEKIKEMVAEWNAMRYPKEAITHLLLSIYEYFPQVHKATPEAQAILLLMIRIQPQNTGYVAVAKGAFAHVLGWGSKRAGRIQEYLDELTQIGAITPIYRAPDRGSKKPGIYKINDGFSKIGQGFKASRIKQKEDAGNYTQSTTTITLLKDTGREEYYCGTLVKTVDMRKTTRDKKRASADQNTDSAESHSDSEPQEHSNQEQQKNQESYTDNMINAEDLLTPEENALFGQMSFSDYPGVVPEGDNNGKTSNAKPGNNDRSRV